MHWFPIAVGSLQAVTMLRQQDERNIRFAQAYEIAQKSGRPLLVVGAPSYMSPFRGHPCGDITLDISEDVARQCPEGFIIADVREIPFPDSYFGAAFCSHVLEHLSSREDILRAWNELNRVSGGNALIAGPSRLGLWNWVIPEHSMFVTQNDKGNLEIDSPISPVERLGAVGIALAALALR